MQYPTRQPRSRRAQFAIRSVVSIILLLSALAASAVDQIGPGVAGQLHALAYDPAVSGTIYAGGDNCGIYKSTDHGVNWVNWNSGMENMGVRKTSYVDDLLVIPDDVGVHPSAVGVYAATHGGICFRASDADVWHNQTSADLYDYPGYGTDLVRTAIPFCSLAFDPIRERLYAGTGTARNVQEYSRYPETPAGGEYSLWYKDLGSSSSLWIPVTNLNVDGDVERVLQIDVLVNPDENGSRTVLSSGTGIWLEDVDHLGWQSIWTTGSMGYICPVPYAQTTWGLGVGSDGFIYALTRDPSANADPGVWVIEPSVIEGEYEYYSAGEYPWQPLGMSNDPQNDPGVPPQNTSVWYNILHAYYDADFVTITVIPGESSAEDQVFVGMEPSEVVPSGTTLSYNGYFRYGSYGVDPNQQTGWMNILYRKHRLDLGGIGHVHEWVDYESGATTGTQIDDIGWLDCYPTGSTVPYQVSPANGQYKFASLYHRPMAIGDPASSGAWAQRYCQEMAGAYKSNGLSVMCSRGVNFLPSGQMIIGCGDFTGFLEAIPGSDQFVYMDPYMMAKKNAIGNRFLPIADIVIINEDVYMLKGSPRSGAFGFDGDGAYPEFCRQQSVLARYEPGYSGADGGYDWKYVSQGIDDIGISGLYSIVDVEKVDASNLFAAVVAEDGWSIVKGEYQAGSDTWVWLPWYTEQVAGCKTEKILIIPGTSRLLVSSWGSCSDEFNNSIRLQELSTVDSAMTPIVWVDYQDLEDDPNYGADHRLTKSFNFLTDMACDASGRWLYLVSNGQKDYCSDEQKCVNVLRVRLPVAGQEVPSPSDWEMLLNSESEPGDLWSGIPFPSSDIEIPTDLAGNPYAQEENILTIWDIVVHPDDPQRVLIGVAARGFVASETFYEHGGIWEYRPDGDTGSWTPVFGGAGEPNKGVTGFAFVPQDHSTLIAGTHGQGFFRVEGLDLVVPPFTAATVLDALHEGQALLMVSVDPPEASANLAEMRVDASPLGLGDWLQLTDNGVNPDWAADDGVWTVDVAGFTPPGSYPTQYSLPFFARDADWNSFHGNLPVDVIETPAIYFDNESELSGAVFSGMPSGVTPIDVLKLAVHSRDEKRDIYISALDDGEGLQDWGTLLFCTGRDGDVPQFFDDGDERFPVNRPTQGHGPATSADLNGDGLLDLIVPSGHSSEGLLIFEQTSEGVFDSRPGWIVNLSAEDQANTWAAACGDYDGDGQIDIYLCRCSVADGELPGPTSEALPDILLRNDLIGSGTFEDATYDIQVPLDPETQQPIYMASNSAEWVGYGDNGGLYLLVADAGTGRGLVFYWNRYDDVSPRMDLSENSFFHDPWRSISDFAIIDRGADLNREYLVTFFGTGHSPELYEFQNLATGGDLIEVPLNLSRSSFEVSGVRVLDYDLDGDQDFILLPRNEDGYPELWQNDGGTFEKAPGPGLTALRGATNGGLVTSLNEKGNSDLFLGRKQGGGKFLGIAKGPATLGDDWVGLQLLEAQDFPVPVNHTVVEFSNGILWEVGGDGRSDHVFRIGTGGENVTCDIYWPSGHFTDDVDLTPGGVDTVYHRNGFDDGLYIVAHPDEDHRLLPNCKITYTFQWMTPLQTNLAEDTVVFDEDTYLSAAMPDVEVRQWVGWLFPDGTIPVFRHELKWLVQPCVQGIHTFQAKSSRGGAVRSSAVQTFNVKICTSEAPDDPDNPPGGGQP